MARYNAIDQEPKILAYWKENKIIDKLRKRNSSGQKFYFLEGPPYTSGKIHLGHAWNMALKDMVLRYKRMQGFNVWDRMGYDMHGLPTEQKTMAKLGLKNKEEIVDFGVAKFMQECEKFCLEMMGYMNEDFVRLGTTLDYSDPYQPISNKYMEAEWWLIKQAHNKNRLYQGLRTMHWDAATQTAVAKHEIEYKQITDTAIYVKFKLKNKDDTYFVIWTTTPWTIPLNLAIMANPELDYVEVNVGDENWILAKELMPIVLKKAQVEKYSIKREFKGTEIEGEKYIHCLNTEKYLPKEISENKKVFTVLLSKEYVTAESGTGLVHCAPGCGPEDYEVGHQNHIPPFNCVDESGLFKDFGPFTDWIAKTDDPKFIKAIGDFILMTEPYTHDYPYGERSHKPVIFRTTKQWFFKVEDLKEKLLQANEQIQWNPESGKNAFRNWLENLRDNSISKQRYWGTPIPIWMNGDDYIVIGSIKELEELSNQKVTTLHIPEIDKITIKKDGKIYKRIPDVLDVWIDAGTASWNCLNYPITQENFEKFFPADFILEGKDQIRGWYNLLMVASFLALDKLPFKSVFMHGFVTDVSGVKMSKSLGNIISPYEIIDKYGADVLRYYMCQTNAGEDINFSWDECNVTQRNLGVIWNTCELLLNLAKEQDLNPFQLSEPELELEEQYILSRMNSTIKECTTLMDNYQMNEMIPKVHSLFMDLSRVYIQMVRHKTDSAVVLYTLNKVFFEALKILSVIAPFITETMYLKLKVAFNLEENSISEFSWPTAENYDEKIIDQINTVQLILQSIYNAREKAKLGVRWPVKEVLIETKDELVIQSVENLRDIILRQANIKSVDIVQNVPNVKTIVKANFKVIGPIFGDNSPKITSKIGALSEETLKESFAKDGYYEFEEFKITPDMILFEKIVPEKYVYVESRSAGIFLNSELNGSLLAEGYLRELSRHIQVLRKNAGLERQDDIVLYIKLPETLKEVFEEMKEGIKKRVGAVKLVFGLIDPVKKHEYSGSFKIRGKEFFAWFDKI